LSAKTLLRKKIKDIRGPNILCYCS